MSSATEEVHYEFNNLYACQTCTRFYVLSLDRSGNEPESCPHGHEYPKTATHAKYGDYTVCANPDCENFLRMNKSFTKSGKCEGHGCNKAGIKIRDLVHESGAIEEKSFLQEHVFADEAQDTGPAPGLARSLAGKVKDAESFTTSHHKGKKGKHTANATATHDRGDKADATIRKAKLAAMKEALENLRSADGFDEKKYKAIIARTEAKIKEWE